MLKKFQICYGIFLALLSVNLRLQELLLGRHEFVLLRLHLSFIQFTNILVPATAFIHLDKPRMLLTLFLLNFIGLFEHYLLLGYLLSNLVSQRRVLLLTLD